METSGVDLRQLPDDDVAAMSAAADAEQAKFRAEAARTEDAAAKAREAFEGAPSAKLLTDREVSAQLAANARRAAEKHAESIAGMLAEHTRRVQVRRLAELRQRVDWRPEASSCAVRLGEIFGEFQSQVQAQLGVLSRALGERNGLLSELNSLESAVGTGDRHPAVAFEAAVNLISQHLAQRFGEYARSGDGGSAVLLRHWVPGGRPDRAVAEATLRIPAPIGGPS